MLLKTRPIVPVSGSSNVVQKSLLKPSSAILPVPLETTTATVAMSPSPQKNTIVPSAEQMECIQNLKLGFNVNIEAVAGAGKSTTLLTFAQQAPTKKCLLLTYSKMLQTDVLDKVKLAGIHNLSVFTFHGAASALFGTIIFNDQKFIECLQSRNWKTPENLKSLTATSLAPKTMSLANTAVFAAPNTKTLENVNSTSSPLGFDVLLIDETQDMSVVYYEFIQLLLAIHPCLQICVCGDPRQAIHEHRGAHSDFLTKSNELFFSYKTCTCDSKFLCGDQKSCVDSKSFKMSKQTSPPTTQKSVREWKFCKLSTSYRLTPEIAKAVNIHVLDMHDRVNDRVYERVNEREHQREQAQDQTNKQLSNSKIQTQPVAYLKGGNLAVSESRRRKPIYLAVKYIDAVKSIALEVLRCVELYGPQNVVILAPTVRSIGKSGKSFLSRLIHDHLCKIKLHVSAQDDEVLNSKQIQDKLLITTFHSMKGCERDCVVVMNFDNSYFEFYDKTYKTFQGALPNILYVATTRSKKELIVVADHDKTFWTIQQSSLYMDFDVVVYNSKSKINELIRLTTTPTSFDSGVGQSNPRRPLRLSKYSLVGDPSDGGNSHANANDTPEYPIQITIDDLLRHLDSETIFKMKQLFDVSTISLKKWLAPPTPAPPSVQSTPQTVQPAPSPTPVSQLTNQSQPKPKIKLSSTILSTSARSYKDSHFSSLQCEMIIPFSTVDSAAGSVSSLKTHHENVGEFYQMIINAISEVNKNGKTSFGSETHDIDMYFSNEAELKNKNKTSTNNNKRRRGESTLSPKIKKSYPENFWHLVNFAYRKTPQMRDPQDWMRLAVASGALWSGQHHLARQILHYNWVNVNFINQSVLRILLAIKPLGGIFDVSSSRSVKINHRSTFNNGRDTICKVTVSGKCHFLSHSRFEPRVAARDVVATALDNKTPLTATHMALPSSIDPNELHGVWEFKCGSQVKEETFLKVACLCILNQTLCGYVLQTYDNTLYEIRLKSNTSGDFSLTKDVTAPTPSYEPDKLFKLALEKYSKHFKTRNIHELIAESVIHSRPEVSPALVDPQQQLFFKNDQPVATTTLLKPPSLLSSANVANVSPPSTTFIF